MWSWICCRFRGFSFEVHGVTFQDTLNWISTAMKIINVTERKFLMKTNQVLIYKGVHRDLCFLFLSLSLCLSLLQLPFGNRLIMYLCVDGMLVILQCAKNLDTSGMRKYVDADGCTWLTWLTHNHPLHPTNCCPNNCIKTLLTRTDNFTCWIPLLSPLTLLFLYFYPTFFRYLFIYYIFIVCFYFSVFLLFISVFLAFFLSLFFFTFVVFPVSVCLF